LIKVDFVMQVDFWQAALCKVEMDGCEMRVYLLERNMKRMRPDGTV
jgi:hypothetical protein